MTNAELIAATKRARQNTHDARKGGATMAAWGASIALSELIREASRRKINMCLIFGDGT